jgi:hypothetical protein
MVIAQQHMFKKKLKNNETENAYRYIPYNTEWYN